MKNPFRIAPCTSNDAEKLAAIAATTFVEAFGSYNTEENMQAYLKESYSKAQINKELENTASLHFFLLHEDEPVGFMKLNFAPAQADVKDPHSLEVQRIYIKKEYWGHGLGNVMMDRAMHIAKENQLQYVWLGVWDKNERAIQFYTKQGFKPFGSHTFLLGTDEQTDILMKLELIDLQH